VASSHSEVRGSVSERGSEVATVATVG